MTPANASGLLGRLMAGSIRRTLIRLAAGALLCLPIGVPAAEPAANDQEPAREGPAELRQALDGYLDRRWLPPEEGHAATLDLAARLQKAGVGLDGVEKMLRAGRAKYPPARTAGKLVLIKGLECEHVDYTTAFFLYVPKSYDAQRAAPLLLIGHGGNSAMSDDYALRAALSGLTPWLPVAEKEAFILAAPLTGRGWGPIGNSILLSLVSRLQRSLNIDADRICVTGHSMGGHLSWRSGIYLGDRWGSVAPMSGGYDYVETQEVYSLINVPGYSVFGRQEPYNINKFNCIIKDWMVAHGFEWQFVEKGGGHEIYADELPKVARFIRDHPRDLYRRAVCARAGKKVDFDSPGENEKWPKQHHWQAQRPIPHSTAHWLRLFDLPADVSKERSAQKVWAQNLGQNRFRIVSQNARRLRIYLHPRMVDFQQPVEVTANGKVVFEQKVSTSIQTMLELVREFDDRGRIFHAAIDFAVSTDAETFPEPRNRE